MKMLLMQTAAYFDQMRNIKFQIKRGTWINDTNDIPLKHFSVWKNMKLKKENWREKLDATYYMKREKNKKYERKMIRNTQLRKTKSS